MTFNYTNPVILNRKVVHSPSCGYKKHSFSPFVGIVFSPPLTGAHRKSVQT